MAKLTIITGHTGTGKSRMVREIKKTNPEALVLDDMWRDETGMIQNALASGRDVVVVLPYCPGLNVEHIDLPLIEGA